MKLVKGGDYLFEFDGWADKDRLIEAFISKEEEPTRNYGKIGPTLLSRRNRHYSHSFTMNAPTDFKTVAVFNVGASSGDVFIDNVSLKQVVESSISDNTKRLADNFTLVQVYPNPFNLNTKITYQLVDPSRVKVTIYNINGRLIRRLVETHQEAAGHTVTWDGRNETGQPIAGGIYFCRLEIRNVKETTTEIVKMTLIK